MKYSKNVILKNNKNCLIRNAVSDDAGETLNIFIITHEQTDFLTSYKDEISFDMAYEKKFLVTKEMSDKEIYLCAVVDGHIVGTAGVDCKGTGKDKHRAQFGIAIDKDFWGIGIGRALTISCIECAKYANYSQLELEVVSDNNSAIALYKSLGFVEFGRNPRGFKSRCCEWQELVMMRLELD